MGTAIRESSVGTRLGKRSKLGMFIRLPIKDFSCLCLWTKLNWLGKKQNISPTWKILVNDVDLGEPTSFLGHVYLGWIQRECQISKVTADNSEVFSNHGFLPGLWSKERYFELANKTTPQLYKVSTPSMDDHQFREEENGSNGDFSTF